MSIQSQSFWKFSLELYDRGSVAPACLELQNRFDLDINLVLFCYWYGYAWGEIDTATLNEVVDTSSNWKKNVVQPLRNVRKWMKLNSGDFHPKQVTHFNNLRQQIKADELDAEKYQQEAMERVVLGDSKNISARLDRSAERIGTIIDPRAASRFNLEQMLKTIGVEENSSIELEFEKIDSSLS